MSTFSETAQRPPRQIASYPVGASMLHEGLLRHPDSRSESMMTRRGWWLLILNLLIPGSAQAAAGNRRLARIGLAATLTMWVLVVLVAATGLLWRQLFIQLTLNWFVLTLMQILLVGYALLWVVLTVNTVVLIRLVKVRPAARLGIALLAALALVVTSGGVAVAAGYAGTVRQSLSAVFGESAAIVPPSDGYYNILLLGADSGAGRDSMRYDSISVVSINAETGATLITGIPRDMENVPFSPGPMAERYPEGHEGFDDPACGWGSGINQLRTEVELCRAHLNLYPDAEANGSEPGIEATKDAAEGVLGIEIPYYVFIDMDGFAALIDALGGVEIDVAQRLPEGGGPAWEGQPAEEWATGWIEAGPQRMDGATAQWYARSRYTTSDWDRMGRQRILQQAVFDQFTPQVVLTRFNDIAEAGTQLVKTDLPQSLVIPLADLAVKAKAQPVATLELIPPDFDPEDPNFARIQSTVKGLLHPATDEPEQ